jgi:hypothetical protein
MENMLWTSTRLLPVALRRALTQAITITTTLATVPHAAFAQQYHGGGHHGGEAHGGPGIDLHINPRWRECSFQLDASLTQSAWRQFAGEAGVVTYFRPLTDAEPLGRGRFEVSLVQWETAINDSDAAWNDTFVHPDSTHWLFEGSRLAFPGLTVRAGIGERTDVGMYVTKSPGANYGFYGGQVQRTIAGIGGWAAAARMSFVAMYGPEDLGFSVYGADVLASRRFAILSGRASIAPYAVASASLSRAQEKSDVVDLDDENVFGGHGTVGAVAQFSVAKVALEYSVARVNSMSIKIGFGSGTK